MQLGIQIYQSVRELPSQAHLIDRVRELEAAGFSSLYVMDHHLDTYGDGYLDPLITLSHMAARTERIELGQAILIATVHHPVLLAEQIASLDQISGGRVTAGLGIGWNEAEFATFGIPYKTRARRFEELVKLLRRLWAEDEVDFSGEFFQCDKVRLGVRPYGRRAIPVYLAGMGERSLTRVAELGQGWVASQWIHRDELTSRIAALNQLSGETHKLRIVASRFCCIRPRSADAWQLAAGYLKAYCDRRAQWGHPLLGSVDLTKKEALSGRAIIGDPGALKHELAVYADMGVDLLNLRFSIEGMTPDEVWTTAQLVAMALPLQGH